MVAISVKWTKLLSDSYIFILKVTSTEKIHDMMKILGDVSVFYSTVKKCVAILTFRSRINFMLN